jgi:hypothetical protein
MVHGIRIIFMRRSPSLAFPVGKNQNIGSVAAWPLGGEMKAHFTCFREWEEGTAISNRIGQLYKAAGFDIDGWHIRGLVTRGAPQMEELPIMFQEEKFVVQLQWEQGIVLEAPKKLAINHCE